MKESWSVLERTDWPSFHGHSVETVKNFLSFFWEKKKEELKEVVEKNGKEKQLIKYLNYYRLQWSPTAQNFWMSS